MTNTLLQNLAAMTVASTGTGTITLGAAARINGVLFLSFAAAGVANGDIVAYSILDPAGASEVGFGTYTSAGTTLTRTVTASTNGGSAINMSAAAIVRITARLQDIGNVGQRPGTNTNDSAAAGNVGEYIEGVVASGSAISVSNGVATNLTSISLTAGDWDVSASATFAPAATTSMTACSVSASLTSATTDITGGRTCQLFMNATVTGGFGVYTQTKPVRMSFASTTTVFCVVSTLFTVSTMTVFGIISARRMR